MALVHKDRVKETSTTVLTADYVLLGAVTGFQTFAAIGNTNTCYYCATDGTNWEVGLGTYSTTGPTLARTTILASSNAGAAVSWGAGTRTIFVTPPASKFRAIGEVVAAADLPAATTSAQGASELATDAEAQAKTDTGRTLTPSNLAALGTSATFAGLVELATDAETVTGTDTARATTPANITAAALKQGKHAIWIPATAFVPQTTSPAEITRTELATNDIMLAYAAFDTSADEHVQFQILWPGSLGTNTVTYRYVWAHPSTSTNFGVAFFLQALGRSNDDAGDTAMGTAIELDDTGGTTNDIYISDESGAVTIGGTLAAGDMVFFRLYRDVSDSADNLAVDARILGVMLYVTVGSAVEA